MAPPALESSCNTLVAPASPAASNTRAAKTNPAAGSTALFGQTRVTSYPAANAPSDGGFATLLSAEQRAADQLAKVFVAAPLDLVNHHSPTWTAMLTVNRRFVIQPPSSAAAALGAKQTLVVLLDLAEHHLCTEVSLVVLRNAESADANAETDALVRGLVYLGFALAAPGSANQLGNSSYHTLTYSL
ncbi:hypothetical protein CAOG_01992 [Capsaspora owczarzaki ATCC 30864]|uniref:Ornithine decarboxylase antizyme n=1 Tax=Capsaspora owczarzaki (strain ATCC 30864) TaxID=595528 RepID=A0A0D2WLI6_CAPO3|nr:hypothetical protein CAOG_01992 [Capsaspora owczarzaki ATCC 30864]KJE90733.1 hypothetical protein CAOG_001992 [Capsaspora owczarzaki ATCC 30864]|eukprot:XP_004364860.1 hypothetical protein CAOG_01992 [Capsaspora owczarzaki ATCC 30864]